MSGRPDSDSGVGQEHEKGEINVPGGRERRIYSSQLRVNMFTKLFRRLRLLVGVYRLRL